jgi:hypothetical protein
MTLGRNGRNGRNEEVCDQVRPPPTPGQRGRNGRNPPIGVATCDRCDQAGWSGGCADPVSVAIGASHPTPSDPLPAVVAVGGSVALPGRATAVSLELPENLSEAEWQDVGRALHRVGHSMMWWLGDWWEAGHRYGDRKAIVEAEGWQGPSFKTCKNVGAVVRRLERSRRRDLVPFSHHAEVAFLPPADAAALLDWCQQLFDETGRLPSRQALRKRVKELERASLDRWTRDQVRRRKLVEGGTTVVANMSAGDDGRPIDGALLAWADGHGCLVRIDRRTEWGNPFVLEADGDRDTVIGSFREHYLPLKPSLLGRIHELKGMVLVCWCHPEACHGDVLAAMANER